MVFHLLVAKESQFSKKHESVDYYGHAITYGKWAVIYAISLKKLSIPENHEELKTLAIEEVEKTLKCWPKFDEFIKTKNFGTKYFTDKVSNYELYYKVNALDADLKEFFLQ